MRKIIILISFLAITFTVFFSACVNEDSIKYQRYYSDGLQMYKDHCQSCHMDDGNGLASLIPPLSDTTYLKTNRKMLACYIVYGLSNTITINGKQYDGKMPAEKHLASIDLAKILTYITNSFGNKQGIFDVKEIEKNLIDCSRDTVKVVI
ncbi:copper oxidase [Pedobacter psychrophilus]|uniref:Copper oxidase n=1 Tax=Pedobacter psychrophilus TaxID=1826909 RepID=A0A179DG67_9SPHI|nr:cytochrome c [Pedobacter psychrophilus]OAQ39690.1 copper oxidase [Pedobacter psychrophilus]